jgi:putative methanogen marker protein 4
MHQGSIGIGIDTCAERVIAGISHFSNPEKIICYTNPDYADSCSFPCPVITDDNPGLRMITDLASGAISAAVRGTLPSNTTLAALKSACNVPELERLVLLETPTGRQFFLGPVGVDEGWTVRQKLSLIQKGRDIAVRYGLSDKVGILSGGRLSDIGRHSIVDRTLGDAELLATLTGAIHFEILIEDAIKECGLIIAPDGISGNLIFRTLVFIGNGVSHGAPVLNINKIFIDTSRVNPDYKNALILASLMIK